jgi:hypothetical protein
MNRDAARSANSRIKDSAQTAPGATPLPGRGATPKTQERYAAPPANRAILGGPLSPTPDGRFHMQQRRTGDRFNCAGASTTTRMGRKQ